MSALAAVGREATEDEKKLLLRSAEDYRNEAYEPEIPRAFVVGQNGCPVCGDAMKKHGSYSWIITPDMPFKVKCPECGTVFPDNDFAAYRESGYADKSLLTGKYVDDGRGWRPAEGMPKFWFVAYYTHWRVYKDRVFLRLAQAYQNTGDREFARRSVAMLDKYAEYYPRYNYCTQSRYAEEVDPEYDGRIVYHTWESLLDSSFADSYKMLLPYFDEPDDELFKLTGKTHEQIKRNIEDNMFRTMASDIMSQNGKDYGNFGMHQKALLKISTILNDPAMVKWVTDYRPEKDGAAGGMQAYPLNYAIYNNIMSDGAPPESPGYNTTWMDNIIMMFAFLKDNDVDEFALHPSSLNMLAYWQKLILCGRFMISSGDSSNAAQIGMMCPSIESLGYLDKLIVSKTYKTMLERSEGKWGKLQELLKTEDITGRAYRSNVLPAYGFASLQCGGPERSSGIGLSFHNYIGHRHRDALNLSFVAENAPLAADLGFPDSASWDDPERFPYYSNTHAHNTVVVDCTMQQFGDSRLLSFEDGDFAQYVSAESNVYKQAGLYRRNVLFCELEPGHGIAFDVFRVKGGRQHDWFMHGMGSRFTSDMDFGEKEPGTLAGANVSFGEFYDSVEHQFKPGDKRDYLTYKGSGYQFLTDVRRAKSELGKSIRIPVMQGNLFAPDKGAELRVYPIEDGQEIIMSSGLLQRSHNNPEKSVAFITRRRSVNDGEQSVFTTVLESASDTPYASEICGVEKINAGEHASAIKLALKDGRHVYLFDAENTTIFSIDNFQFCGHAGALLLDADGKKGKAFIVGDGFVSCGNRVLASAGKTFKTSVEAVDVINTTVTLKDAPEYDISGKIIRIGDYSYKIDSCDGNILTFSEQRTVCGRARVIDTQDNGRVGRLSPWPRFARVGTWCYRENSTDAPVKIVSSDNAKSIVVDGALSPDADYMVSECGPGDIVEVEQSDRQNFVLE